jgi:hypothetical protein
VPFSGSGAPTLSKQSSDVIATLELLGSLKMQGILTDAEFNAKKTELLNRL